MLARTILLTRPEEEAKETAFFLEKRGFKVLFLPLYAPVYFALDRPLPLENVQGIISTSQQGVQALSKATSLRHIPLYSVGDRTAAVAKTCGFQKVFSAKGTGLELAAMIKEACAPQEGGLLYVRGSLARHDLSCILRKKGYQIQDEILYKMEPLLFDLPRALLPFFKENKIWGALFFSSQTAAYFLDLVQKAGVGANCKIMYLFCLSQSVAKKLQPLEGKIKVARMPDQSSLLETIDNAGR